MTAFEPTASAIEAMTAQGEAAASATEQLAEVAAALTDDDTDETEPGFVVPAWLEDGATLEAFLIAAEIDGKAHAMRAGFVHVDNLPFLGSDSPTALRALALHCAELADRLEARHEPVADR